MEPTMSAASGLLELAAQPGARESGAEWYRRAGSTAADMAERHATSPAVAASVIAALSPQARWSENLSAAEAVLARRPVRRADGRFCKPVGYPANHAKARAIRDTGDTSILSGPKVTAFRANILGDDDYVTLDVWALRAVGIEGNPSPAQRASTDRIYRFAAEQFGQPPAQFQATVWCAIRGSAS